MTKRTFKNVGGCALGVAVVVACGWYVFEVYREDARVGRTKWDLRLIGQVTSKYANDIADVELWERISTISDFCRLSRPQLQAGRSSDYHDEWNQPYLLAKLVEPHEIVFTLYSDHPIRNGVLGIEVAVSRSDGTARVKQLWDVD